MPQKQHVIHGRDHSPNGADPVTFWLEWTDIGAATYSETILVAPSLVGYWPLNEASGDALDGSGNGYTLTKKGTPTQGVPGPFTAEPAMTATAFDYAGDESLYVAAQDAFYRSDAALDGYVTTPTGITVEAWVYPTANPSIFGGIIQSTSGDGANIAYGLQHRPGGNIHWNLGNSLVVDSVTALTLNTWTHIVGTASTTNGTRLYFNGALVGTPGANFTPLDVGVHFHIDGYVTATPVIRHFLGRIAQVALYSTALTAAEALAHYNAGTA